MQKQKNKKQNKLLYIILFVNVMIKKKPTFLIPIQSGNSGQEQPRNGMSITKFIINIIIMMMMIHIHTKGGFFLGL